MPDFDDRIDVLHNGEIIIQLRAGDGRINVGRAGIPGSLIVADETNAGVIFMAAKSGTVHVGKQGTAGTITLDNVSGRETIRLDGESGDIILANADCAEEFDVDAQDAIEAGMVMVIGDEERLQSCRDAYDRRVAGVLSGAGDCRPGIILGKRASSDTRLPLALNGKVFCRVDAHFAPVGVGDLLTTSPTRGHAMKALDPARAFGAVIGKALRPLKQGCGLIPVLVALQ